VRWPTHLLLTGQKVMPARAEDLGYRFHHPRLGEALESILK
jgi:NAD dependent epimerase/dehydratase family enzyme